MTWWWWFWRAPEKEVRYEYLPWGEGERISYQALESVGEDFFCSPISPGEDRAARAQDEFGLRVRGIHAWDDEGTFLS